MSDRMLTRRPLTVGIAAATLELTYLRHKGVDLLDTVAGAFENLPANRPLMTRHAGAAPGPEPTGVIDLTTKQWLFTSMPGGRIHASLAYQSHLGFAYTGLRDGGIQIRLIPTATRLRVRVFCDRPHDRALSVGLAWPICFAADGRELELPSQREAVADDCFTVRRGKPWIALRDERLTVKLTAYAMPFLRYREQDGALVVTPMTGPFDVQRTEPSDERPVADFAIDVLPTDTAQ
jgi:hypothetical protein